MMITAKEAFNLAIASKVNKVKEEKERIYNAIKTVATDGLYKLIITINYEETLEELERLGYIVTEEHDYNTYSIDWSNIEE